MDDSLFFKGNLYEGTFELGGNGKLAVVVAGTIIGVAVVVAMPQIIKAAPSVVRAAKPLLRLVA